MGAFGVGDFGCFAGAVEDVVCVPGKTEEKGKVGEGTQTESNDETKRPAGAGVLEERGDSETDEEFVRGK